MTSKAPGTAPANSRWHWLPHKLETQLMLLVAASLLISILGYGAYTAKGQTDQARATITAQMTALAQNLATVNAFFLVSEDFSTMEEIAKQTATVPGIFSVLVTDIRGKPLVEVVNQQGHWSPRYSTQPVRVPGNFQPIVEIDAPGAREFSRDFLAGHSGVMSAWHPVAAAAPLGWVRVSYRLDSFDRVASDIWTQALLAIAFAIAATLGLLAVLLRRPMQVLRHATRFAAELDQSLGKQLVVSHAAAEMQALGYALNSVSTRLFEQHQALASERFALDQHAIVSVTDLQGNITYANDRFCSISGYSHAELMGANHRIVKSGFHPDEFYANLWQCICSGQVWQGEICNRARDGSFYWVDATIVPLLDALGLPRQFIAIRSDITAAKALQESLQEARKLAEAANRAKSEFLANMSHEIRTPMNGVIGMTDLALETPLDETQRSYLNVVKSSARSLLVILNDILDFSKIEAGKLTIEAIVYSPRQTITEALQPVQARALHKGLALGCEIAPELPEFVLGDPGRIRQVLTNLCDNAIKFTAQGRVDVRVTGHDLADRGYELQVTVQDSGTGIAPDKQELIFSAFAQADSSTTRQFGGTGLGLTICARLVELMGGRIWVQSVPGQGSSFHFTVRTARQTAPATPDAAGAVASLGPARVLSVLLVEDNKVNQLLATTLLKKWGHEVTLAQNGQEAVELFPTARWDVVLMDMQMPVMGGVEATQLIRAGEAPGQHTPIIAVTANAMAAEREQCLQAGMDDHLAKPIRAEALRELLEKYGATA
jgi:PAS domain S-box-containing protein